MIIDTHAHLNDHAYDNDRKVVIHNLLQNNVEKVICASYDFESIKTAFELAQINEDVYCALGVHPENVMTYGPDVEKFIIENAKNNKVVALGEIGLDYHYEGFDKNLQKEVFVKQIKLAHELGLPIIVHVRDSVEDAYQVLKEFKHLIVGGVMHCFSSSVDMAKKFIDLGLYLGFGGVVTFKNAKKIIEVVENIDLDHFLLETDCPYLCPEPFRGQRNEPKHTNLVAKKIAELKNISVQEVENITTKNAKNCFKKLI